MIVQYILVGAMFVLFIVLLITVLRFYKDLIMLLKKIEDGGVERVDDEQR